jgi:hypothetical protein
MIDRVAMVNDDSTLYQFQYLISTLSMMSDSKLCLIVFDDVVVIVIIVIVFF